MPVQPGLWGDFAETDSFCFERKLRARGYRAVAGVDEAGRGPLAGPVVAACVILPPACDFKKYRDSKVLSAEARRELHLELTATGARIGIGIGSVEEIDRLNILQASLLAMQKAVESLGHGEETLPDYLLVDGRFPVPLSISQQTLIKGESRSASIAAASIVAKVTRDGLMEELHRRYPRYNFNRNKGYATLEHRRALMVYGPCELHRREFRGVRPETAKEPSG